MRRVVPAILFTVLGVGVLANFRTTPPVRHTLHIAATAPRTTPTTAPPRPTTPATSAPPSPTTDAPATTAPPTTQPPAQQTRTVDGDPIDNRFGTVQVRVTLQGSQITDVTTLQMPSDHMRSAMISQEAEPYLQQEALQAQSANIQIISGATYTSDSYAQSLQSALDKAGA